MAITNGYATLAQLRQRFSIDDPFDDAILEHVLGAVSRLIEQHCGRVFYDAGAVAARVFYPDSTTLVTVDDFHTTTGLVVKTDDDDDGTYETTWTISTDFQVEPLNGVVDGVPGHPYKRINAHSGERSFTVSRRPTVEVTADWGWASVPEPVREACLLQASRLFNRKGSPFGVAGVAEFGQIRLLSRLDPDVELMLAAYSRFDH